MALLCPSTVQSTVPVLSGLHEPSFLDSFIEIQFAYHATRPFFGNTLLLPEIWIPDPRMDVQYRRKAVLSKTGCP